MILVDRRKPQLGAPSNPSDDETGGPSGDTLKTLSLTSVILISGDTFVMLSVISGSELGKDKVG